jgi:riboflavin biosynthesis pyrimidine reductase
MSLWESLRSTSPKPSINWASTSASAPCCSKAAATFLQADLVDEVSLLEVPGIDGRRDIPTVFDGVNPTRNTAVPLKLKSVEQRANDTLWIRYTVVRS